MLLRQPYLLKPGARQRPRTKAGWALLCTGLTALVGFADYATGYEISLAVLYLAPVFIGTWTLGRAGGMAMAVLAAATWFAVFIELHPHPSGFYHLLDALVRGGTWIIFAWVIDRLKRALAQADERFVTVLERMDAAVYVSDRETGELLYANEQFRKIFPSGSTRGRAQTGDGEFHNPANQRWYLQRTREIRWVDGRLVHLHIATDITDRKHAEETSRLQQEKLQMTARLITVGEMASTLAHEINQPLAAIANYNKGSARRLRSGHWDAAELLEAMEKSGEQAERAGKIIQRVREFVRKREPAFAACDLNAVLTDAARMADLDRNDVALTLALAPDLPAVRADRVMVEQVILNLMKNAVEAMQELPREQRALTLRSCIDDGKMIRVDIADRGHGLPPALENNLFTAFYTTKPDGMGMGLHICRSIVEMHGGRLWATRNPAGGTVFHFTLPRS